MFDLLGVIGFDDAIVLGLGGAGFLIAKRMFRIEKEFLEEHGDRIEQENERVVEAWRASRPRQRKLVIQRTFKPPGFLRPVIGVKRKYKRDPRPWYKRIFS